MVQTFALLCNLANSAISSSQQRAERTAWCLLADILIPFPEPQNCIPNSKSPLLMVLDN